jgi:hypothetical protein
LESATKYGKVDAGVLAPTAFVRCVFRLPVVHYRLPGILACAGRRIQQSGFEFRTPRLKVVERAGDVAGVWGRTFS